jgi:hypothetical protein
MIRTLIALAAPAIAAPALAMAPPAGASEIAAAVAADWPKYDQGGKGHLTQAEFATWLSALRAASGKAEDPARVKAWADEAFPQADGNKDDKVTPEELTGFLQSKVKKPEPVGR